MLLKFADFLNVTFLNLKKEYLTHVKNCQALFTSRLTAGLLKQNLRGFVERANETKLAYRDSARKTVAKCHLDLMALDSAIDQVVARRGYTFEDVQSELNAIVIMAQAAGEHTEKFNQLLVEDGQLPFNRKRFSK